MFSLVQQKIQKSKVQQSLTRCSRLARDRLLSWRQLCCLQVFLFFHHCYTCPYLSNLFLVLFVFQSSRCALDLLISFHFFLCQWNCFSIQHFLYFIHKISHQCGLTLKLVEFYWLSCLIITKEIRGIELCHCAMKMKSLASNQEMNIALISSCFVL